MAPQHITVDIRNTGTRYDFTIVDGPSFDRLMQYRQEFADHKAGSRKSRPSRLRFVIKDERTGATEVLYLRPFDIQPLRTINNDIMLIRLHWITNAWEWNLRYNTVRRNGSFGEI